MLDRTCPPPPEILSDLHPCLSSNGRLFSLTRLLDVQTWVVEHQATVGVALGVNTPLLAEAGRLEELERYQCPQRCLALGHRHR